MSSIKNRRFWLRKVVGEFFFWNCMMFLVELLNFGFNKAEWRILTVYPTLVSEIRFGYHHLIFVVYGVLNFATAQSTSRTDPVYAMFQCRNYHSNTDCATCFAAAAAEIRNSSVGTNAAHVVYDGCFLKYTSIQYLFNSPFLWLIIQIWFWH